MIGLPQEGLFLGRVWRAGIGPAVVTVRGGRVVDITTKAAPTMRFCRGLASSVQTVLMPSLSSSASR